MSIPLYSAKLFLGNQQPGADPSLTLITAVPALHVPANRLDNGEGRLDDVRACHRLAELHRKMKPVNRQRFLQSFCQAPCRAGVEIHQFPMQNVQCVLAAA